MKPNQQGLRRVLNASVYSWQGLKSSWQSEAAIRQEIVLIALLTPVAFLLHVSALERAVLLLSLYLILVTELINTAIEAVVDRVGADFHPLSGKAKDVGSATVLVMMLCTALTWACILWS
ncbi:diacylglycerol kinase [Rheinheimera marina]|uniref:Diacylglycerol kinase n=1 Tax=Rheinheimera marina TaxID=1774958 RepID=A0ABV9JIE8_9GAMM